MKEKAEDIFSEISKRVKNPFVFSFCIAWLIRNWKLIIALFSYNQTDYKAVGYSSFADYMTKNSTNSSLIYEPVVYALLYVLLMPIFSIGIRIYNAAVKKWGLKQEYKKLKGAVIPFDEYLVALEAGNVAKAQVSEYINTRIEKEQKISDLSNELNSEKEKRLEITRNNTLLEAEKNNYLPELARYRESISKESLFGTYTFSDYGTPRTIKIDANGVHDYLKGATSRIIYFNNDTSALTLFFGLQTEGMDVAMVPHPTFYFTLNYEISFGKIIRLQGQMISSQEFHIVSFYRQN